MALPALLHPSNSDLPQHHRHAWLDGKTPDDDLEAMLKPFDAEAMDCYRVTPKMINPRIEDPAAVEKYEPEGN